jgi:hypothetical protein
MNGLQPPSAVDRPLTRAEAEEFLRSPLLLKQDEVQRRCFPHLAASTRIADLRVSVRVQNCLRYLETYHGLTDLSLLSRFTIGQLLRLENFGLKSMIDLLSAVIPIILDHATNPVHLADHEDDTGSLSLSLRFEKTTCPLTRAEAEELLRSPHSLMRDEVRMRRFPRLVASVRITDLPVSVRVQNCIRDLEKYDGLTDLSLLSRFTLGQLLHTKNFGRKSLINLLSAALPIMLDCTTNPVGTVRAEEGSVSASLTRAAERLRAQPYSARVRCTDPRFKSEVGALLFIANSASDEPPLASSASLHAVAHRLVGRTRDKLPPERTLNAIVTIRRKIARARKLPLERELKEIAGALMTARNVEIALSLFGWSGNDVKTLQIVGNEFDMTRERVRQITSKFTGKLLNTHPCVPTLRRTLAHINKCLPSKAEDIEADLCRSGLTQSVFRLEGIVAAAQLLGVSVPFIIEEHGGVRTAVRHADAGLAKAMIHCARKVVSHAGLGKVADICDQLQEETGTAVPSQVVRSVLQSLGSLHWLDDHSEWFFLDDVPRNHLLTLITKVLSVAPSINVNEMRSAIASDYRGMGFSPPKSVVLEFCRVANECNVEGDNIIAVHAPPVTEVLSKLEQVVYSVLTENGPLLHRDEFEQECIGRGMNQSTFLNYVARLPILARYGSGVYGLRGAPIQPGDVERCVPPARKRLRDYGWTANACLWLAVELSPAALSSGVITVPSGLSRFVEGKYLLRTQDGSEVGTLVISGASGWGLKSFFGRRGGEPGDVIVLTLDLRRHEAALRLGTKEDMFPDPEIFKSPPEKAHQSL